MKKAAVGIVDMRDKEIYAGVKEAVDLLGGMSRFVKPGELIFIKPNMFLDVKDYTTGLITDPRVTVAVSRLAREAGGRVVVGERTKFPQEILADYPEIYDYAEVITLDDAPHYHGRLYGARHLQVELPIPRIVDECDVFINLPGLRMHMLTRLSNGLKNLMGLMPGEATKFVHQFGLEGSIVDLNFHRPSDLVITDAIYSLQGNFPGVSSSALTEVVMAADNVVAADTVAALAVGMDPESLDFLIEAHQRGLGPIEHEKIEIRGESLAFARDRIRLEQTEVDFEPFRDRLTIIDNGACPACRRALVGGLTNLRLGRPDSYQQFTPEAYVVILGPAAELPAVEAANVLCYGNCTHKHGHGEHRRYEFGCPPLAQQVGIGLNRLGAGRLPVKLGHCPGIRHAHLEEIVPEAAALGYQGMELWCPQIEDYESRHGEITSLVRMMEDTGLEAVSIGLPLTLTQTDGASGNLCQAEKFIAYARAFGTNRLRVLLSGPASSDALPDGRDKAVEGLRKLCDLEKDFLFLLETCGGQSVDTAEGILKLLRKTGRMNLRINLSISDLLLAEEDPGTALERLYPVVENIRLKSEQLSAGETRGRSYPEDGRMNLEPLLQNLRKKGFNGYVCVDSSGEKPGEEAARQLRYLRKVLTI